MISSLHQSIQQLERTWCWSIYRWLRKCGIITCYQYSCMLLSILYSWMHAIPNGSISCHLWACAHTLFTIKPLFTLLSPLYILRNKYWNVLNLARVHGDFGYYETCSIKRTACTALYDASPCHCNVSCLSMFKCYTKCALVKFGLLTLSTN